MPSLLSKSCPGKKDVSRDITIDMITKKNIFTDTTFLTNQILIFFLWCFFTLLPKLKVESRVTTLCQHFISIFFIFCPSIKIVSLLTITADLILILYVAPCKKIKTKLNHTIILHHSAASGSFHQSTRWFNCLSEYASLECIAFCC
jgi:hypothetical protein